MSEPQLFLNETCIAIPPHVVLNNMTAEEARRECTKPLLVIILASARLFQDITIFSQRGPYKKKELSEQFLLAASYQHILLKSVFQGLEICLSNHKNVMAEENYIKGNIPSLGHLLETAEERLAGLTKVWGYCVLKIDVNEEECTARLGRSVPTAAPREILIRILANHPTMINKLAELGVEKFLAKIGEHLYMPGAPRIDSKQFETVNVYADGSPKMYFICHHVDLDGNLDGNLELLVGANEADWTGLPALEEISRANRDTRLESYLPLANRAFASLRQVERSIALPQSIASQVEEKRLFEIRSRAVAAMKNPPHPDFLFRTTEFGQAFSNTMHSSQCCYACQGMMGYKVAKKFKAKAVEKYLAHFKWELRGDYAHSCAEIETSLQCAIKWQENW